MPTVVGVFGGITGGIALIIATLVTTKGILQISPYPVFLIAAILTIKYTNAAVNMFGRLFTSGFLTFIIMSLILYVYIVTFNNPNSGINFIGHLWRFGIVIGLGIISSSLLSFIAKPIK